MKKRLLPTLFTIMIMIGTLFFLAPGCAKKIMPSNGMAITVGVSAKLPTGVAGGSINQYRLTVRARDLDSALVTQLKEINGYLIGQLEVPAGKGRLFVVEALSAEVGANAPTVVYRGQAVVDISPLDIGPITIELVLKPVSPVLRITPDNTQMLMGDSLELDIFVHRATNMYSAYLYLELYNVDSLEPGLPMYIDTIYRRSGSNSAVGYYSSRFSNYVLIYSTTEVSPIVDSFGDAYLATVKFQSYADWGSLFAEGALRFTTGSMFNGTDLYDSIGLYSDSIPGGRMSTDEAAIYLINPLFVGTKPPE